jgi:hypothetical protein
MAILRVMIMPAISPLQGFLIARIMVKAGGSGRFPFRKAQRRPSGI